MSTTNCPQCGSPIPSDRFSCPNCVQQQQAFDDGNPYASPPPGHYAPPPAAMGYDYKLLASRYRFLILSIGLLLLNIGLAVTAGVSVATDQDYQREVQAAYQAGEEAPPHPLGVGFTIASQAFGLIVTICLIVSVILLGQALRYGVGMQIILVLLMFLPCISLITLIVLSNQAHTILKTAGYRVGILGPDMRQFG